MNWYEKNIFKNHWYTDVLGGILFTFGIFYTFFSHLLHTRFAQLFNLPTSTPHSIHVTAGIVMLLAAVGIWWFNNKLMKRNM